MVTTDPNTRANRQLAHLSRWLDEHNDDKDPEARTWGRVAKVAEEAGEAIAAMIAITGQNPRKRQRADGDLRDLTGELYDVAVTALAALAHINHNVPTHDVLGGLLEHLDYVHSRAGLGALMDLTIAEEAEAETASLTRSWDRQGILGEIAAQAVVVGERGDGWGTYDAAQAIQATWRLASRREMDKRLAFLKIAAMAIHGIEYIDAREEADPTAPDEHRCPAKVEKWRDNPAYHHLVLQCQLNAGHDGDHRHHGDERNYWPGKGGLTDEYDWVEVDAREEADQ